jgi:cytochrome c oxidase subunit 2
MAPGRAPSGHPQTAPRRRGDRLPRVVGTDHLLSSRRRTFALAAGAALLGALIVTPTAMADFMAPMSGGSPNADKIASLWWYVMVVAAIIFLIVEGALVWCIVKYRRTKHPVADQIHGNTNLEIGWTVGAAVILVILGVITFLMLPGIRNPPNSSAAGLQLNGPEFAVQPDAGKQPPNGRSLNIAVNGQQYVWRFTYPDATPKSSVDNVFAYEQMVVPLNTTVTLTIKSQDVAHSWWIPELGGKFDAVPGYTNHTWFKATKLGVFKGQCAELCGRNHANMLAQVKVVTPAAYLDWYATKKLAIKRANTHAAAERQSLGTPKSQGSALDISSQ